MLIKDIDLHKLKIRIAFVKRAESFAQYYLSSTQLDSIDEYLQLYLLPTEDNSGEENVRTLIENCIYTGVANEETVRKICHLLNSHYDNEEYRNFMFDLFDILHLN